MKIEAVEGVKAAGTAGYHAEDGQEQAPVKEKRTAQEAIYSVSEFAANARKSFGTGLTLSITAKYPGDKDSQLRFVRNFRILL